MQDITINDSNFELETMKDYLRIPMTNNLVASTAHIILGPGFTFQGKNSIKKGKKRLKWIKEKKKDGIYYTFLLSRKKEPIRRLVYLNGMLIEIEELNVLHRKFIWNDSNLEIPSKIIDPQTKQQIAAWVDGAGQIHTTKLTTEMPRTRKGKKPKYNHRRQRSI